ncbi:D-ribose ABC transporter substrate-binding protein [Actinomyces wuliandei]|uniref:D-ribose ABC transporter substrate-binding protein n=1 Tax=Actinomyces wuliandei TaxID=2057743 RepID=UPI000FD86939|nr:D-ribose ABC transporter substrate-binding protein [Actinomyces wuliandei]
MTPRTPLTVLPALPAPPAASAALLAGTPAAALTPGAAAVVPTRRSLLRASLVGCVALPALAALGACSSRGADSDYIAVITPAHDNPYFKTEADAAVDRARALGYAATAFSHRDDVNVQSELIDSAVSQRAAAIILDNAGADSTEGASRRAVEAGVPVFLIDREINEAGIVQAQIVANNSQGAALVAQRLAEELQGKGRYYELVGRETDTNAAVRSTAFHSVLDQYEGLELAGQETANWDQQEAYTKVETLLQRDSGIQAIICGNDTMAVGAVAAVQQAGRTGDIVVAGFDGSPDAVDAIKAGTMLATGMQPAVLIAQMAVEQAHAYVTGGSTGKREKQLVDCVLIDESNAQGYTLFEMEEDS